MTAKDGGRWRMWLGPLNVVLAVVNATLAVMAFAAHDWLWFAVDASLALALGVMAVLTW